MERIHKAVNWETIEALLSDYYEVGRSNEGADAYPPLMLLKCFLLRKWFHIPSDLELENQITDRISLKKFLGLSLDKRSPDYSTFSRFRNRLSKEAMIQFNSEILLQFAHKGLSINKGIAIDARLVKSASTPMSNEGLKKLREKRTAPEGRRDTKGTLLKFSRDVESDRTIKNDIPHYGLKEHTSVDVEGGFVLATTLTAASEHDFTYLPYLKIASCHTKDPIEMCMEIRAIMDTPTEPFSI